MWTDHDKTNLSASDQSSMNAKFPAAVVRFDSHIEGIRSILSDKTMFDKLKAIKAEAVAVQKLLAAPKAATTTAPKTAQKATAKISGAGQAKPFPWVFRTFFKPKRGFPFGQGTEVSSTPSSKKC